MKRNPMAGRGIALAMIIALVVLLIGKPLGIRITFASAIGAFVASCVALVAVETFLKPRKGRLSMAEDPDDTRKMSPAGRRRLRGLEPL